MASTVLGRKRRQAAASHNSQSIIRSFAAVRLAHILLVAGIFLTEGALAQVQRSPDNIQLGAAALPGIGMQVGYVDAGDILTREATVYADVRPRKGGPGRALQVSAAVGVGVRIVGALQTMTLIRPRIWDLHLGMRFGPSLIFRRDETLAERNQRFSLFLDPYVRSTVQPRERMIYFLEVGVQRPSIRAGVWLTI